MELYTVFAPCGKSVVVHKDVYQTYLAQTTLNQEQQLQPEEIGDHVKNHTIENKTIPPKNDHNINMSVQEIKRLKTRERVKRHRERKKEALIPPALEIRPKNRPMTALERVQLHRQRKKMLQQNMKRTLQLERINKIDENQLLDSPKGESLNPPKSKPQHGPPPQQAVILVQNQESPQKCRQQIKIQEHLTKALELISLQQPSNSSVIVKDKVGINDAVPFGYEMKEVDVCKKKSEDSSLANQNVVESSSNGTEQFQDDNHDEFKSLSAYTRNSFYDRDDFDTFGSFVASELRGLRNDVSLIRKVKKKIQLAIIEAYDTHYESETTNMYLPSTSKVSKQQTSQAQPFHVDSVEVKVESPEIDLTTIAAVKAENVAYEGY